MILLPCSLFVAVVIVVVWFTTTYDIWAYPFLSFRGCLLPLSRCYLFTNKCDKVCQSVLAGRWFSPSTRGFIQQYNWNIVESGVKTLIFLIFYNFWNAVMCVYLLHIYTGNNTYKIWWWYPGTCLFSTPADWFS